MPENTYDPSLSPQPLGMAGGVIDDDEWNKIQAAADQIAQEATRAGIPSQPDDPEDRTALEKRAVDEQVANIQRAHLWVPPQVTREHQDNSDVLQALDDMASEYVDQKMRHSAHWKLKAAMNKRGIDIRGKWRYHRLIREALARADQSFGRMWDKVLDPGRTKKLLANAILQTVAEETKLSALNRYGPGEWDTVWQVQQGTMRRPDLVKDARDFYNLMQNFKAYKQYVDEEGYYDPQAYRGAHHNRDEVVRLYWAVTGQAVPRAGYPTQWHGNVFPVLHGFAKGTDWAQQTARAVVPLQIMGVKVGPEHVDQEGVIPAGVFPQYEKEMATYGAMLATGYSMTDPESMAEFKTLAEAEDKIRHTPGAFLKELTGRPQPAAAAYLEQFPNPNTRWTKFFQLINPDRRGVIESSTPGVRRIIPPINAISNYKQWAAKRHAFWLEQQQNIPHNLAEHVDASITDDDLRFLRQAVLAERNKHWDRIK
ncbi:MAG: hypothetical protein GTO63_05265, partial [Anaerolineae bacterium]|nr:hypothetical protein [Anaerolineae bacterium]NIN94381.1 hypothetical protein [Anaerolineae bacterium]NIQ77446.1 hypothetical protein [Anaerolineae bacterium]